MADRILVWHVDTLTGDHTNAGPTFVLDRDYTPTIVSICAKSPPNSGNCYMDILDDGVSIFTDINQAILGQGETADVVAAVFPDGSATMEQYSVVTLNLTPSGASGITVQLELEALPSGTETGTR